MNTLETIINTTSLSDIPIILHFLTTWCLLLIILHRYLHKYIDILMVSTVVLVAGSYVSYINPRKYILKYEKNTVIVEGLFKTLTVDMIHIFMFLWSVLWYGKYYLNNPNKLQTTIGAIALLITYYLVFNPSKVYEITEKEVVILTSTIVGCYVILLVISSLCCFEVQGKV